MGPDPATVDGISAGVPTASGSDSPTSPPAVAELPADAITIARNAAIEEAGTAAVGDYLGAVAEDDVAVSAAFASADRGYRGWYWSVTLALVDPAVPTVSEVVLLPGQDALLAPPWVPWEKRVRAGDIGPGDLLPTPADDIRVVPGYVDSDDPAVKEVAYEFGLGRERVLSREGRDDAAERWHEGSFGPDDPVALAAPANCISCAFYVPLAGLLGSVFGACANEYSPADGRVVDAGFGCGAHSQTVIEAPLMSASTDTVVDELILEVHARPQAPRPVVTGTQAPTEEPEQVAVLDPAPDADPDLLADVVSDPVVDEVVAAQQDVESGIASGESEDEQTSERDVAWDLHSAWPPHGSAGADDGEREGQVDGGNGEDTGGTSPADQTDPTS